MKLQYIRREILDDLKLNYSSYKDHYFRLDKKWFQKYFQENGGLQDSKIECEDFTLNMDQDHNISDMKNIVILYSALKKLPVSYAIDERLWAGLAHGQLWDYVQYRRKEEIASKDEKAVKTSFFYIHGAKRSSHIQCLARLWWAGHLTYDPFRDNPFELTEVLCKKAFASNLLIFSSSNLTSNKELCLGILSSIKKRENKGEEIKRAHFVEATRYLNSMGSVTILDCLDRADVEGMVDDILNIKFGKI